MRKFILVLFNCYFFALPSFAQLNPQQNNLNFDELGWDISIRTDPDRGIYIDLELHCDENELYSWRSISGRLQVISSDYNGSAPVFLVGKSGILNRIFSNYQANVSNLENSYFDFKVQKPRGDPTRLRGHLLTFFIQDTSLVNDPDILVRVKSGWVVIDVLDPQTIGVNHHNLTTPMDTAIRTGGNTSHLIKVEDRLSTNANHLHNEIVSCNDFFTTHTPVLYPNPAKDRVNVDKWPCGVYSFSFFNLNGRLVSHHQSYHTGGKLCIDLGDLGSGRYFLQLESTRSKPFRYRLQVQ